MKWKLIYFDDQPENIECFQEILEERYIVVGSCDGRDFPKLIQEHNPHAYVLDVHMPILDGHTLYKQIIDHPLYNGCPIFFISGDQSDENKIRSYESGGLDFLSRNLKLDELMLRLSNKIKFYLQMSTRLELRNLRIDVEEMRVFVNEEVLNLTLLEMRILCILLRGHPQPTTRTDLIKKIWGNEAIKPATINTHIANLRPKLADWQNVIKIKGDLISLVQRDQ